MRHARLGWLALAVTASLASAADLTVWVAPEGYKIDKFGKKIFTLDKAVVLEDLKKSNTIWSEGAISLAGARGEVLAFQLIVEGGSGGVKGVNVGVGDLAAAGGAGVLPGKAAELFKVYYTEVTDKGSGPTNSPTMGKGWYPDALVPWDVADTDTYGGYDGPPFDIKAGEAQAVWVDLTIPYGTPAGRYSGQIKITAAGAEVAIPLTVRVYDFDIPRKLHKTFFMNFGLDDLNQAGGYWLKGEKLSVYEDAVYRMSRQHRFTAGNMYNNFTPKAEENDDGSVKVDWTEYDRRFEKVLSPANNLFGPGADAIEIWKVPLGPGIRSMKFPKKDKCFEAMAAEIKKHWQEKGWDLSRAYVYLADEPGKDQADKLNDYARRLKAVPGPALGRQIAVYTILGRAWNEQKPIFDLWKDNLDLWMVAGDYYHVASMDALPKGHLKGMYQGAEPYQGNETLDADGVAMRTWSWVAWQYGIDYLCYYSMSEAWRGYNLATKKAFENNDNQMWDKPRNRSWGLSQGVFIYPGKKVNYDLPIWNIRTKQIRRGQTDYEYFWLLAQAGQKDLAMSLCKGVLNVALSEAADAPEKYGAGKWSHNPADWDRAIRAAGEKLHELAGKLPREP